MASIELMFVEEHLKKLRELEDAQAHYILGAVQEPSEYPRAVGYIQAIKQVRIEFEELLKAYFPENYDRKRK